jgi:hypothetical protein
MVDRESLSKEIALHLLKTGGWGNLGSDSIEFDFNREDSQASILNDTVTEILDYLLENAWLAESFYYDSDSDSNSDSIWDDEEDEDYFMSLSKIPTKPGIHTTTTFSVYLARNSTFSDLVDFVSQLRLLQVEDDTKIRGTLMYGHTVKQPVLDRMHCLSCDVKDYIVLLNGHECEANDPEKILE